MRSSFLATSVEKFVRDYPTHLSTPYEEKFAVPMFLFSRRNGIATPGIAEALNTSEKLAEYKETAFDKFGMCKQKGLEHSDFC